MADEKKSFNAGQFKPGHAGGPGRPKGSRNKLAESFISALANDFDAHGEEAIRRTREERPADYVKVVASILPKEIEVKTTVDELSDEDLAAALEHVRTQLSVVAASAGERSSQAGGRKPH